MYYYPAKFINTEKGYTVKFIDFDCTCSGETLDKACKNATEALGKYLNSLSPKDIPTSTLDFISYLEPNNLVLIVCCDLNEYRRKHHGRFIRKNVTLPSWLNDLAEKENINFSHTLREALKKELNIE